MTVVLTIDEVADLIHKSRRRLREWLRDHPRDAYDRPLFGKAGRTLLFTPTQVQCIVEFSPLPLKLLTSRSSKTMNFYIRGTYLGVPRPASAVPVDSFSTRRLGGFKAAAHQSAPGTL
jgi:hypothetical protein